MSLAGKYQLEERLGGGGMAEVYRARTVGPEGFSRPVAVKRVVEGLAEDPRFLQMFATEAKLSARLSHPNVVMVLDFDRDDDGLPYIVMELVDGPTLDQVLDTGAVPLPACVQIATEILRGLGYAHAFTTEDGVKGIVHRDVSPHNVLLSWEGAVKISDFGIAKARAATLATASEMVKGKPAYMSPEQANAEALDGRSDLFAVGVILWEMLAGRPLFSGGTTQETFAKLMFAEIPPPSRVRPEVPADLDRVTMRLLARDRADRYPDAAAVIAALLACRDQPVGGVDAVVALLADRFPASKRQPLLGGPRAAVSAVRTRVRRRWGWLLSVGVALLGVAMVILALVGSERPRQIVTPVAVPDAREDDAAPIVYDHDASTLRSQMAMIEALREACPWPDNIRLRGIRQLRPDGTLSPPVVMTNRLHDDSASYAPAPKPLAACVQRFMAKVKPPTRERDYDRVDEDYGVGLVDAGSGGL